MLVVIVVIIGTLLYTFGGTFIMPPSKKRGYIVLLMSVGMSVCRSVGRSVGR